MSQPTELIIANTANEVAAKLDMIKGVSKKLCEGTGLSEEQARTAIATGFAQRLLFNIAHHASPTIIRKALAALGAPHEDDEIWGRLEAALEAQKREAGESSATTSKGL